MQHSHTKTIFIFSCVVLVVLGASWWLPTGRAWWGNADEATFYFLNGWVASGHWSQIIWAFANTHYFDMLAGCVLALPYLHYVRDGGESALKERCASGLFIVIILFVVIATSKQTAPLNASPSLVLTPLYDLNQLVPWLEAKVYAGRTFPSDHGIATFTLALLIGYFAGWRYGLLQLVLALAFCLPRLVSGAHWLSDIAVGSTMVTATVSISLLCTPLAGWLMGYCRRAVKIPVVYRLCHLLLWRL